MCFNAKNTQLQVAWEPITCYKLVYFTFLVPGMQSSNRFFQYFFDKTYSAFNWKNRKRFLHFITGFNGQPKSDHYIGGNRQLEVGFHSFRFITPTVARDLFDYAGIPAIISLQHALVKCTIPRGSLYRYNRKYNEILSTHIRIDAIWARVFSPVVDGIQIPHNNLTILHKPAEYIGVDFRGKCQDFNTLPGPERLAYVDWSSKSTSS